MKDVTYSDASTENYHLTLLLLFIAGFGSLFNCPAAYLPLWFTLTTQCCFQPQQAAAFSGASTVTAQPQAANRHSYRDELVNGMVEHLTGKESHISLSRWWRLNTELKDSEYSTYIHQLARNTNDNFVP